MNNELYRDFIDRELTVIDDHLVDIINLLGNVVVLENATGNPVSFNTSLTMPLVQCKSLISGYQEGTGTPSPDNIRDFIGFSGVNIQRTGKNYFDNTKLIIARDPYPYSDVVFNKAVFLPAGTYTVSISNITNATSWRFGFRFFDNEGNTLINAISNNIVSFYNIDFADIYSNGTVCLNTRNITRTNLVMTLHSSCYVACVLGFGDISASTTCDYQIELGSTATPYEPYTGNTYTISFGQTVYSANLDVLTGILTITHGIVDLGSLTWRYGSGSQVFYTEDITDMSEAIPFDNMACSAFEVLSSRISLANMTNYAIKRGNSESTKKTIYVKDTDYTDADDFKTAVTGMKLVYELATPLEIPLTPAPIKSIIGLNSIVSNTGDLDIKYLALATD